MKNIYFLLIVVSTALNAQTITIADAAFKAKLLSASTTNFVAGTGSFTSGYNGNFVIDQNGDGEIQLSEAQAIQYLDVRGVLGSSNTIHSLAGIENFSNLEVLFCQFNSLTSLNLSVLPNLNTVNCENNQLISLNANGLTDLRYLFMRNNQLTNVDFSSLTSLEAAGCANNLFAQLDFHSNPGFFDLGAANNPNLNWINLKNNHGMITIIMPDVLQFDAFYNCPNLDAVCVDEEERVALQNVLDENAGHSITCTTDCSLSVPENNLAQLIKIYPNPVKESLNISFDGIIRKIQVFDLQGRTLVAKEVNDTFTPLDVSGYAKGAYLISITTDDGSQAKRFVKE